MGDLVEGLAEIKEDGVHLFWIIKTPAKIIHGKDQLSLTRMILTKPDWESVRIRKFSKCRIALLWMICSASLQQMEVGETGW